MKRRALLRLGPALPMLAWAHVARTQPKTPVVIGWLNTGSRHERSLTAFRDGMAAHGWIEARDYTLEERWADGKLDRVPALARELAAKKAVLIVAAPGRVALELTKAAPNTPVVQVTGDSPVLRKLARSLARPGGLVTGLTTIAVELAEKHIELLLTAVPRLKRIGVLVDAASDIYGAHVEPARRAAEQHRIEIRFAEAARKEELEAAVARLAKESVQGLAIRPSAWFSAERAYIVRLALAHRWPVIAGNEGFVAEGALLSYGVDIPANFRRAAWYVDRILKGTRPGDLPIEQVSKFELVVNLKTAKSLGLTIPQAFLMRADRIIE